ncbi:MAG: M48 family metalloprotease [Armatimonadota bacterium]
MRSHPRRHLLALVLLPVVLGLSSCRSGSSVSKREEVQMGRETAQAIERQYRTRGDATLTRIGNRLAAYSERPDLPWSFRVIESPEVNAISLPGGPIYIFEGLLQRIAGDEDMIAGVLGHEIGHVEERHAVRQMERSQLFGLGAEILGRATSGDVGAAAQIAANLELLSYSRRQEYDSDDAAIRLMRQAGYDPQGLVRLLELLRREGGGGGGFNWLRTHPTPQARVDRAREQVRGGR